MSELSAPATQIQWRDGKRYAWMLGAVIPLLPLISWGLVEATGIDLFWYFAPVVFFGVVPLVDLVVGLDRNNPPEEVIEHLENDRFYRWITYAFIPIQYASLIWGAWMLGGDGLDVADKIGLAIGLGVVAGIGINTAHELGHKKEQHERWLARVALAQTFYGHFFIEHNRGHHARVATPEDPASSRLGENVWQFLPRTMMGSLTSAWHLESSRLRRRDRAVINWHNDVLDAWAMSVLLWGGLMIAFGWEILPYLVLQALVGIWLLESVNFLEHYGMLRAKNASGRYERPNPSHSWNSNNIGTNVLLYHLQRHSDHHANPLRRYQALRDFSEAPVLPTGYAGMIVLTWVPALWRRVMDPKVIAHFDGDLTRANIHPRKRERILARHAAATTGSAPSNAPTTGPLPAGTDPAAGSAAESGPEAAPDASRFRCPNCDYVYDEAHGDPREGWPAGTPFSAIPATWGCPDCGVRERQDFLPLESTLTTAS
ncbi:MAG TPA: fatty acid desaturase [Pseudonocardia sp.]|jgi:alkane 1-monooxygenase|nr:fatty acid desaturase [Pseudonocardia sp.]